MLGSYEQQDNFIGYIYDFKFYIFDTELTTQDLIRIYQYNDCIQGCPQSTCKGPNINSCAKCNEICKDCWADKLDKCSSCYKDDYYDFHQQTCLNCSKQIQNCLNCSLQNFNVICTECDEEYFVSQKSKQCFPCNAFIYKCKNCVQDTNMKVTCNTCDTGFKLSDNLCFSCTLLNCLQCDDSAKKCLKCKDGYFVNEAQSCQSCEVIGQNCTKCLNSKECIQCALPLKLTNNQCLANCSSEQQDFDQDLVCENCDAQIPFCEECDERGVECSKCIANFINKGSKCVNCTEEFSGCESCKNNQCIGCKENLLVKEGKCVESCPQIAFFVQDKECLRCDSIFYNCIKCNEVMCTECQIGFIFFEQCPSCINQKDCKKCKYDKFTNASCVSKCEADYQICEECNEGFHLNQGECIKKISIDQYKSKRVPQSINDLNLTK